MNIQVKIMVALAVVYIASLVIEKYFESRVIEPISTGPLQVITEPELDPGTTEA